jgi:diacylglycerol kinase family enzyme
MPHALVIVNPRARRGAAVHAYARIRAEVEAGFQVRHALLDGSCDWLLAIDRARREGVDRVVAVGGDGTVHAVANALLSDGLGASREIALGAVGLGSSNDFHKPVRSRARGVPVRIGEASERDVGRATWEDARGRRHARWFLVSASMGLTARANRRFSRERGLAGWLGRRSVDAAIGYAAIGALLHQENAPARLSPTLEAAARDVELSNLGVMLTPYLAGAFRYDTEVQPGGGRFAVHLCEGMTTLRLLSTMAGLLRGRFVSSPQLRSWASRAVTLELDEEDDLELDGELFRARSVHFEAFSRALSVCA